MHIPRYVHLPLDSPSHHIVQSNLGVPIGLNVRNFYKHDVIFELASKYFDQSVMNNQQPANQVSATSFYLLLIFLFIRLVINLKLDKVKQQEIKQEAATKQEEAINLEETKRVEAIKLVVTKQEAAVVTKQEVVVTKREAVTKQEVEVTKQEANNHKVRERSLFHKPHVL